MSKTFYAISSARFDQVLGQHGLALKDKSPTLMRQKLSARVECLQTEQVHAVPSEACHASNSVRITCKRAETVRPLSRSKRIGRPCMSASCRPGIPVPRTRGYLTNRGTLEATDKSGGPSYSTCSSCS